MCHRHKKEHVWLDAHLCVGVRSNIVVAAVVRDGNSGDSPEFKGLVRRTADGFEVEEVSADKAYSSRENHEVVGQIGGIAYIPFRKNATARAGGSTLWKRAFHYFQLHRPEFDAHYHKRSNAESAIMAIKAKFGETLLQYLLLIRRIPGCCDLL